MGSHHNIVNKRFSLPFIFTLAKQFLKLIKNQQIPLLYAGRTIGIKLRYDDFRTVTRDLTLPCAVADAAAIRAAAGQCLKRTDLTRPLRLLGVRAASLVRVG